MAREKGAGRDAGLTAPGVTAPLADNDLVSSGPMHEVQTNDVQKTGRSDGMVAGLDDPNGFDAAMSGNWKEWPHSASENDTQRSRPEVRGQLERGYVLNEAAAAMNAPNITEPDANPGGAIKSINP